MLGLQRVGRACHPRPRWIRSGAQLTRAIGRLRQTHVDSIIHYLSPLTTHNVSCLEEVRRAGVEQMLPSMIQ